MYRTLFVCAAVTLLMAWRVDINQFSMHMFYRNRLVACFLGASNSDRSPNRFTGFDPGDDLPLKDFRWNAPKPYDGPYPVLNASLNLVKGKDLAWQERKAESFVMTPHFCGYDVWLEEQDSPMLMHDRPTTDDRKRVDGLVTATATAVARQANVPSSASIAGKEDPAQSTESWLERALDTICKTGHKLERFGYRATEDYAFPVPGFNGPNLGLAMAISGAAVSPNMGFYSSTPVAFLMTIFNVRLGQWLGNPRHPITSRRATPRLGLWWLINELLGGTNDDAAYVYLSDGGHFENMGLYELVKRRCGLIIVCDAEADENYTFSGIGNAIRKCRIDLGIDIDLDTSKIAPPKAGRWSEQHCVVGRIHYENADQFARTGIIIYFKASLTGDEDADVKNYKKNTHSFPTNRPLTNGSLSRNLRATASSVTTSCMPPLRVFSPMVACRMSTRTWWKRNCKGSSRSSVSKSSTRAREQKAWSNPSAELKYRFRYPRNPSVPDRRGSGEGEPFGPGRPQPLGWCHR